MVAQRYSGATWRPIPEAETQGHIVPVQVILHTIVGSAAGAISVMHSDRTPGEAHLVAPFSTGLVQLMPFDRRADCQWKANAWVTPIDLGLADGRVVRSGTVVGAISIETEDDGTPENTPWTANQLDRMAEFLAWANRELGIPLDRCPNPFLPGVGYHSMWGMNRLKVWEPNATPPYGTFVDSLGRTVNVYNPWTNTVGKSCPAEARIAQFAGVIAAARALVAPPPPVPGPDPSDPTPPTTEVLKMLIVVGNKDNPADPRRWVWDGGASLRLLANEADYQRLLDYERVGLVRFDTAHSTLASPFWMPTSERALYGQS